MDNDIIMGIGTGVVLVFLFFWACLVGKSYDSKKNKVG